MQRQLFATLTSVFAQLPVDGSNVGMRLIKTDRLRAKYLNSITDNNPGHQGYLTKRPGAAFLKADRDDGMSDKVKKKASPDSA